MLQQIRSHFAASLLGLFSDAVFTQPTDQRRERGQAVVRSLNNGMTQSRLKACGGNSRCWPRRPKPTHWTTSGRARVSTIGHASSLR